MVYITSHIKYTSVSVSKIPIKFQNCAINFAQFSHPTSGTTATGFEIQPKTSGLSVASSGLGAPSLSSHRSSKVVSSKSHSDEDDDDNACIATLRNFMGEIWANLICFCSAFLSVNFFILSM